MLPPQKNLTIWEETKPKSLADVFKFLGLFLFILLPNSSTRAKNLSPLQLSGWLIISVVMNPFTQ